MYTVVRAVTRRLGRARPEARKPGLLSELSETDLEAVLVLGEQGECTAGHLASALGVPATTGTTIADRLVKRRLIARRRSEEDRRSVWLALTERGEELLEEARADQLEICRELLSALEPKQRSEMIAMLSAVAERAGGAAAGGRGLTE